MWLVTGTSGYLGSHLTDLLQQKNVEYLGIDLKPGRLFKDLNLDIRNIEAISENIKDHVFEGVIHLAALKDVASSESDQSLYNQVNVEALNSLLPKIKLQKDAKIILASSAAVYGITEGAAFEDYVANPISYYGETKLRAEAVIKNFGLANNFSTISLRFFNLAGCRTSLPFNPLSSGVISNLIESMKSRIEFELRGNRRNSPDGTAVRDYLHVEDAAMAIYKVMKLTLSAENIVVNVGTGSGTSLNQLVEVIKLLARMPVRLKITEKNVSDIDVSYASTLKLQELLGWVPNRNIKNILISELVARNVPTPGKSSL